jgi:hypothetical protein
MWGILLKKVISKIERKQLSFEEGEVMSNIIVGLVILIIVATSILKIISEKRKGAKCVGCPYSRDENCNCK